MKTVVVRDDISGVKAGAGRRVGEAMERGGLMDADSDVDMEVEGEWPGAGRDAGGDVAISVES
jgi:hypothetical protein